MTHFNRVAGPDARLARQLIFRGARIDAGLANHAFPRPAAQVTPQAGCAL